MAERFLRDGEGRFIAITEDNQPPENYYVPWKSDLCLVFENINLRANAASEGWIVEQGHKINGLYDLNDTYTYSIFGDVSIGHEQSAGLITVEGVTKYKGRLSAYLHVGDEKESHIMHLYRAQRYSDSSDFEEVMAFQIYTSSERIAWFHDQITRRPTDKIGLTVIFNSYVDINNLGSHKATRHIEPDNVIEKSRRCPILGAEFNLSSVRTKSAEEDAPQDGDRPGPPQKTPTAPSPHDLALVTIGRSLRWIIGLLALLAIIILLKGCDR